MKFLFKLLPTQFKIWLYTLLYYDIAGKGEYEDTELAHINAFEKNLLKKVGGAGKRMYGSRFILYCNELWSFI